MSDEEVRIIRYTPAGGAVGHTDTHVVIDFEVPDAGLAPKHRIGFQIEPEFARELAMRIFREADLAARRGSS